MEGFNHFLDPHPVTERQCTHFSLRLKNHCPCTTPEPAVPEYALNVSPQTWIREKGCEAKKK
jgi:hypothetical protein